MLDPYAAGIAIAGMSMAVWVALTEAKFRNRAIVGAIAVTMMVVGIVFI
jgi:hypothetical protein